jgi:hypothetical protein
MVSRRAFLRGGSLAGLASVMPIARAEIHAARALGVSAPFEAVCDTRRAEGDAFLEAVSARAFRSHAVGADPGEVLGVVADATAAGRSILGLTSPSALMIARQMAAAQGYGLVFRGEHAAQTDGRLSHRLHGDDAWLPTLAELLQRSPDGWPTLLGRTLVGLPADRECRAVQNVTCTERSSRGSSAELASWVLAPIRA